ncbi:MAG: 4Fe-4S dicluster domain-containing protein [Pseudomonadota bacterium]
MSKTPEDTLLVCNCQRTMHVDGDAIGRALGRPEALAVHSELCRGGLAAFERALEGGRRVHVACRQEAPLFREVAAERGHGDVRLAFTGIREEAGWCEDMGGATPKMAALLAAGRHVAVPAPLTTLTSDGVCLVYGKGQIALDVARALESRLSVSVLLTDVEDALPPRVVAAPIARGRIRSAKGALGNFDIVVDGYAPMLPSSRRKLDFAMPRDGASSRCDVILDVSGGTALFPGGDRRDGYLRADPGDPAAVAKAMLAASDLVGEFEKPIYVDYNASICAHARSQKVGCRSCLDHCPLGAITPDGDHVKIDPAICGGCGNCAAVCPTGAASYAFPARADVITRAGLLVRTYLAAGGTRPVLLLHDERHGGELVGAMARFGRGLPANVLPLGLYSVLQTAHELLVAMLVLGAEHVVVLVSPERRDEMQALTSQIALGEAILAGLGYEGGRLHVLVEHDPDAVEAALYGLERKSAIEPQALAPLGGKRDIARVVMSKLHARAPAPKDVIALPKGAPYGRIVIDTKGCTLCLSCVGACPAGALGDSPERPEVRFTEAACVQCGVCAATCPEKVITLEPRYDFTNAPLTAEVLHGEEPFHCVRCGTPFGARSSVERIVERLKGHTMFQNAEQLRLIQMCDNCRVVTLAESADDPFRGGERPRVRTTEDYHLAEEQARKTGKKVDDFLS